MRFIFIFLSVLLFGCCKLSHRSLEIDLPDTTNNQINAFNYQIKNNLTEELNLISLENANNVDTFELRIWAKIEPHNHIDMYNIKNYNGNWICFHYGFTASFRKIKTGFTSLSNEDLKDLVIDSFKVEKIIPKSGWINFLQNVKSLNINNLPSQSEIPYWKNEITDGIIYWLEEVDNDRYKFILYNCPDYYANKYPECKKFNDFINIFKSEIGLPDYGYKWDCSP